MWVFFWIIMLMLYVFFSSVSIWFNSIIWTSFTSWLIWNRTENVLDQDLLMKNITTETELDTFFPKCFANVTIKTREWSIEWIQKVIWRCMEWNNWKWYRIFFFTDKSFTNKTQFYDENWNLKDNWYVYFIDTQFDSSNVTWWVHQYKDKRTHQIIDSDWKVYVWNEIFPNRILQVNI